GNIVQSMNVLNTSGYIVVNNANKIEVVEAGTFKSVGTITGLNAPRYILQVNDQKAYITEWGNGSEGNIRILNLTNNSIEGTINLNRKGAEKMLKHGDYVYVTCQGGYDKDSVVTVIDANT